MSAKIVTQFGHAVPPAPRHSVTVHMPGWENVEKFGADSAAMVASFHSAYPRSKPHRDIDSLASAIINLAAAPGKSCFIFSSLQSAEECIAFATSSKRNDGNGHSPLTTGELSLRAFHARDTFFAVLWPSDKRVVVNGFWSGPGAGVSSRFAESNLEHVGTLVEVPMPPHDMSKSAFETPAHHLVRDRIVSFISQAPSSPSFSSEDVYLFQTGMAAIYKTHSFLLKAFEGTTVLFGMAFMDTVKVLQEYGRDFKFFGMGTDAELDELASFLRDQRDAGRKVQSIWAEVPANPLLFTPNVGRLRALADENDALLIIDDTVGSWANIDVVSIADMTATSLTKSFSGYADVIAGSMILNPKSRAYCSLKSLFESCYVPELYNEDALALERNSRDYLERTQKLNHNAQSLVDFLDSCAQDPQSAVSRVYYPTTNASGEHYRRLMHPATANFKPGYGCLFAVELRDMATTEAFYDNLNIHKGPHLGAPFTLAFAYTMCAYKKSLDWAAGYGLKPTQIRISAGLEDTNVLLQDFKIAVSAADQILHGRD